MTSRRLWREMARPPGEPRGLGVHDGALAALTSDGLFTWGGDAWRALDPRGLGASVLPSGRLVIREVSGPATQAPAARDHDTVELTAFGVAPDGAVWSGVRTRGLSFYAAPGPGGMRMMHPAYPVSEHLARDGVIVRDGLAARDLAFDGHGRMWVAAANSLEVLDGGAWRTALGRATSQVAIASDGTIVVGSPTTGFCSRDGRKFDSVPARATEQGDWGSLDLDGENVRQIERAPDGALWGRIDDGILAWTGDRWTSCNLGLAIIPRKGRRDLRTLSLAIVGSALHVATTSGVFARAPQRA